MDQQEAGLTRRVVARVRRRLGGTAPGPEEVTRRLNRQHERIAELERELARVSPQLAALEERVADLQSPPVASPSAGSPQARPTGEADPAEVAQVLADIRAEHARVRARISAAARYEERLRRLEEQVAGLDD